MKLGAYLSSEKPKVETYAQRQSKTKITPTIDTGPNPITKSLRGARGSQQAGATSPSEVLVGELNQQSETTLGGKEVQVSNVYLDEPATQSSQKTMKKPRLQSAKPRNLEIQEQVVTGGRAGKRLRPWSSKPQN